MSQKNISEIIPLSVGSSDTSYDSPLSRRNKQMNLPANNMENIFGIISSDKYYQCVSKNVFAKLRPSKLTIDIECICDKISLIDFPDAPYILSINGFNIMTSKNNKFDIHEKKTDFAIEMIQHGLKILDDNLPIDKEKAQFINLPKYTVCSINYSSNIIFDKFKYDIEISGYFYENNEWIYKSEIINFYPKNTYDLDINFLTESIDFVLYDLEKDFEIKFLINGKCYEQTNKIGYSYRLKLKSDEQKLKKYPKFSEYDEYYKYFNDYIKKNTYDFDKKLKIVLKGCKIRGITQHYYMVYYWPSKTPVFEYQ